ncbi:MAG: hypothetical protein KDD56_07585 [Bdellovibrionales bacterium]|nr:hypothetical protein [Bdellovibrionales bacterium]
MESRHSNHHDDSASNGIHPQRPLPIAGARHPSLKDVSLPKTNKQRSVFEKANLKLVIPKLGDPGAENSKLVPDASRCAVDSRINAESNALAYIEVMDLHGKRGGAIAFRNLNNELVTELIDSFMALETETDSTTKKEIVGFSALYRFLNYFHTALSEIGGCIDGTFIRKKFDSVSLIMTHCQSIIKKSNIVYSEDHFRFVDNKEGIKIEHEKLETPNKKTTESSLELQTESPEIIFVTSPVPEDRRHLEKIYNIRSRPLLKVIPEDCDIDVMLAKGENSLGDLRAVPTMVTLPFYRYNPKEPSWLDYSEVQVHFEKGRIIVIHDGENSCVNSFINSGRESDYDKNSLITAIRKNNGPLELSVLAQLWCASMDSISTTAYELRKRIGRSWHKMEADSSCVADREKIDGLIDTIRNLVNEQDKRLPSELKFKYPEDDISSIIDTFKNSAEISKDRLLNLEKEIEKFDRHRTDRINQLLAESNNRLTTVGAKIATVAIVFTLLNAPADIYSLLTGNWDVAKVVLTATAILGGASAMFFWINEKSAENFQRFKGFLKRAWGKTIDFFKGK